jgi:hypothetical protein
MFGPGDLTYIVFATGWDPAAELTDSLISATRRSPLKDCPHWRSVFSSVFKEPKLGHFRWDAVNRRSSGLVPAFPGGETLP